MTANMKIVKVIAKLVPDHCGHCEFGHDSGWLDKPPENECLLMYETLEDTSWIRRPDWCPLEVAKPEVCWRCHGSGEVQVDSVIIEGCRHVEMAPCPECEE